MRLLTFGNRLLLSPSMSSPALLARLRRVLRETGWTQADLAPATGASRSTVSKWISDAQKRIDLIYAFRLQDASGFCARWILHGEGPVHVDQAEFQSMPAALRREMHRHAHTVVKLLSEATQS